VEAKRLVLGELDAAVAAEDEMLRDRCGLGSREVVLGTYKCVDRHATAGNLVLSACAHRSICVHEVSSERGQVRIIIWGNITPLDATIYEIPPL
jgi:hypothetical protein